MTSSPAECRVVIVENEVVSIECWSYELYPPPGRSLASEWAQEFLGDQSVDFFYGLLEKPSEKHLSESGTFQLLQKFRLRLTCLGVS